MKYLKTRAPQVIVHRSSNLDHVVPEFRSPERVLCDAYRPPLRRLAEAYDAYAPSMDTLTKGARCTAKVAGTAALVGLGSLFFGVGVGGLNGVLAKTYQSLDAPFRPMTEDQWNTVLDGCFAKAAHVGARIGLVEGVILGAIHAIGGARAQGYAVAVGTGSAVGSVASLAGGVGSWFGGLVCGAVAFGLDICSFEQGVAATVRHTGVLCMLTSGLVADGLVTKYMMPETQPPAQQPRCPV